MLHYNITISGKVHGVGFRYAALQEASLLGIKGFAKNQANKTVYIEAEAEQEALEVLLRWCKSGPPRARVENVLLVKSSVVGFDGFRIR